MRKIGSFEKHPNICTPLIGHTRNDLIIEAKRVKEHAPDMIEWRADYYENLHKEQDVITLANDLKEEIGDIPLLFTIRSEVEGGNPISLTKPELHQLLHLICKDGAIDLIDYEMHHEVESILQIRSVSKKHGKRLILSYHNFEFTPSAEELFSILKKAESLHADIGKIAVMPRNHSDVLKLLNVTADAEKQLSIPIATMAMGKIGAISRMAGWIFGSHLIFAVGNKSSAPGQILIEDLRTIIETMKKYQD
ncbi:type I 3-dehydroquinate dehydratase [Robertmurraya sp. DFI.2.37]|uniref:type I 3-dehydroquinate dehydratase n=1 Tax=Robertmurraya sp. DFI.2.37 TaxID=3031819 RepID=UPI001244F352|nr:type I 3-dehydroquinate dehydratase [Robertmurraya sp. DFI.2.37]MDF1509302.1 type I 3-dehydroquinate dehydratase [Robertmurraya sp. DFI.2.37]